MPACKIIKARVATMQKRLGQLVILAAVISTACGGPAHNEPSLGKFPDTSSAILESTLVMPRCNLGKFSLCGYVDAKIWKSENRNEIRIPAKFEAASPFNDGLALVRYEGKYGYIDSSGKFVIAPRFKGASSFKKGLAPVIVGNQIGVINSQGDFVIEPRFSSVTIWDENTLIARDGTIPAAVLSSYRDILSLRNVGLRGWRGNRGIFDIKTTQWVTPQEYKFREFNKDTSEFIWANKHRGNTGLLRRDGQWQLKPQFSHAQRLIEDRAIVSVEDQESGESKRGAIDGAGKVVITPQFSDLTYWNNGYALTRQGKYGAPNRKHGLVDKQGKLMGERFFDEVRRPAAIDDLPQVRIGKKWHVITADGSLGETLLAAETKLHLDCKTHSYLRGPEGYVVVDAKGKRIVDITSQYGPSFFIGPNSTDSRPRCDLPASLNDKDKGVAIIMPDGTLFANQLFENTRALSDGVLSYAVNEIWGLNEKWGLIDQDGNVIVTPKYDQIWSHQNLFLATKGDAKFFIDTTGHTEPINNHPRYNANFNLIMKPREDYLTCPNGNKLARKNGKWGMTDPEGKTLIAFNHRALSCYTRGVAWAPVKAKQQWCPIGINGKIDASRTCVDTYHFGPKGTHSYPQRLDENGFESSVLWNELYLGYGIGDNDSPPHHIGDGIGSSRNNKWLAIP